MSNRKIILITIGFSFFIVILTFFMIKTSISDNKETSNFIPNEKVASDDLEDFEPEGISKYEINEYVDDIDITILNIEEMSDVYNDMYNTTNLRYYIRQFLNENAYPNESITVSLLDNTCIDNIDSVSVKVAVDKYDLKLDIKYIKADKSFLIKESN